MSTNEKRLDKIEDALSPKAAFLLWMAEAHQHETFAALVLSLKDVPIEEHPYRRLTAQIEQAVRTAHKGEKPGPLQDLVIKAVREVAFYYELHEAVVGRVATEWRALTLQMLLALELSRRFFREGEPTQDLVDRMRHMTIQSFGEFLQWQRTAQILADKYLDGVSILLPAQEQGLHESLKTAQDHVELVNDHIDWLRFLQEPEPRSKRKSKSPAPKLVLEPIDVELIKAEVEAEAMRTAEQIANMAKAEAAAYVHQTDLAAELLDRVRLAPI